jgi:hypothetical protein
MGEAIDLVAISCGLHCERSDPLKTNDTIDGSCKVCRLRVSVRLINIGRKRVARRII